MKRYSEYEGEHRVCSACVFSDWDEGDSSVGMGGYILCEKDEEGVLDVNNSSVAKGCPFWKPLEWVEREIECEAEIREMTKPRLVRNAAAEFLQLMDDANSPLVCATIWTNDAEGVRTSRFDLPAGFEIDEFELFIKALGFDYEELGGFLMAVSGVIWFESTWAERVLNIPVGGLGTEAWQLGGRHKSPIDHRPAIYDRLVRRVGAS
jgi:hypothetical protein